MEGQKYLGNPAFSHCGPKYYITYYQYFEIMLGQAFLIFPSALITNIQHIILPSKLEIVVDFIREAT